MQYLLNDDDGPKVSVRTIVARALERNSQLLALLAEHPGSLLAVAPELEPQLLRQMALWRLLPAAGQPARAREAGDRLRQAQRQFEAAVIGLAEAAGFNDSHDAAEQARPAPALMIVQQRLQRQMDQNQPRRYLEQLLLDDARALQALAADMLDPSRKTELDSTLADALAAEAEAAEQRCWQALQHRDDLEACLRGRRWLLLHLEQMELFAPHLSEQALRALWYRQRLLRLLERCAGLEILLHGLQALLLAREITSREQQQLSAVLTARRATLWQRAVRLQRHGFAAGDRAKTGANTGATTGAMTGARTSAEADALAAAAQRPAANAALLDEPSRLGRQNVALPWS